MNKKKRRLRRGILLSDSFFLSRAHKQTYTHKHKHTNIHTQTYTHKHTHTLIQTHKLYATQYAAAILTLFLFLYLSLLLF